MSGLGVSRVSQLQVLYHYNKPGERIALLNMEAFGAEAIKKRFWGCSYSKNSFSWRLHQRSLRLCLPVRFL